MKAIINYPGSKWLMAHQICQMIPPHRSYVEPYLGSGAVLFNKIPSHIETINDIDGDIVNFFRVVRDCGDELAKMIAMTPYARDVYIDSFINRGDTEIEKAYKFAIRSRMSHGYRTNRISGFKIDVYARERSYCVSCWNGMPDIVREAALRLKTVQIENRNAIELIQKFNHDNVLIYADPPYLMSTRGGEQYRFEMDEKDHIELLETIVGSKAKVIISGYDSELYNYYLNGWNKSTVKSHNQHAEERIEVLWSNCLDKQIRLQE